MNVGGTYQRAMLTLFHDMMHKEIEVCVDDMIAKSREGENHIQILKELFEKLRKYKLRLNHARCSFGVKSMKVVGIYDEWQRDRNGPRLSKGYSIYANSQDWEGCKKVLGKVELHCSVYIPINHDLWLNLLLLRKKNLGIWNKSVKKLSRISESFKCGWNYRIIWLHQRSRSTGFVGFIGGDGAWNRRAATVFRLQKSAWHCSGGAEGLPCNSWSFRGCFVIFKVFNVIFV